MMFNTPNIESSNLSLADIFKDFYIVPDFQREYVWQKDQVQKLLEDLYEGLGFEEENINKTEYFLGSIVVYPDSNNDKQTFQLIDGQQRLTTIYLIFCSIRDLIQKLGDNSRAIENYLQGTVQNAETGEDIDKPRLSLQYDSSGQKIFSYYLLGKTIDGSNNKYLEAISKVQGRVKGHLILLLAGRFLEKSLFEKLSYYTENFLFIISITRKTRRKDFYINRDFALWSRSLREVKNNEDLELFISKFFIPELKELKEDFRESIMQTSGSNLAKYRLKYLLAKINQYVEEKSFGHSESIYFYLDKSITIEHILPKSHAHPDSGKLGNLTLLEKTINSSISDKDYKDKIDGYRQSKILITRTLAEKMFIGNNTQLNRAMSDLCLTNFDIWDHNSIKKRQEILVNIAMKVWSLDVL